MPRSRCSKLSRIESQFTPIKLPLATAMVPRQRSHTLQCALLSIYCPHYRASLFRITSKHSPFFPCPHKVFLVCTLLTYTYTFITGWWGQVHVLTHLYDPPSSYYLSNDYYPWKQNKEHQDYISAQVISSSPVVVANAKLPKPRYSQKELEKQTYND